MKRAKAYHVVWKHRANLGRWQAQRCLITTAAIKACAVWAHLCSTGVRTFARGTLLLLLLLLLLLRRGAPLYFLAARHPLEHLQADELVAAAVAATIGLLFLVAADRALTARERTHTEGGGAPGTRSGHAVLVPKRGPPIHGVLDDLVLTPGQILLRQLVALLRVDGRDAPRGALAPVFSLGGQFVHPNLDVEVCLGHLLGDTNDDAGEKGATDAVVMQDDGPFLCGAVLAPEYRKVASRQRTLQVIVHGVEV